MTWRELDPEARQRRFDTLVDALTRGELAEDELTEEDLELLRELYGEREDDLEDLLEQIRRLGSEEP